MMTGIAYPNDEGLFEVSRRRYTTHEILNDFFGVERIVKIEGGSFWTKCVVERWKIITYFAIIVN